MRLSGAGRSKASPVIEALGNLGRTALATELLDVLDTGVKIGLGALISGVSAYWVGRLNHSKAAEKEKTELRRKMIGEVAESIERLFALLFRYRAGVKEWVAARDRGKQLSEERFKTVLAEQRSIPREYKEITASEAKLLLLGEKKAQQMIRDFGEEMSERRKRVYLNNKDLTKEEVYEFREALLKHRENIFDELARIFNR